MKLLKYYPYRTGYVKTNIINFPRDSMKLFEHELANLAGVSPDNHVCYTLQLGGFPNDVIVSFMFTDEHMIMGDEVLEKRW